MITIRPLEDFDDLRVDFHGEGHDWGGSDTRLTDYHVEASATLDGGFDDATIYTRCMTGKQAIQPSTSCATISS